MTSLDQDIVSQNGIVITPSTRQAILDSVWPNRPDAQLTPLPIAEADLDAYFDCYSRQCHAFLAQRGRFIAIRTHQDVASIISDFVGNLDRQEIRASLLKRLQHIDHVFIPTPNISDDMLDRAIDLAARLFLMIKIGSVPHSITNGVPLQWNHGTIRQFTLQQFDIPPVLSCNGVKLPKLFNARNLERIGGIRIRWTSDLTEHLRMVDDDERVAIFGHPTFLMLHANR